MPTQIAVIVVNYGTPDLAIAAVESVLGKSSERYDIAVHLVDNASPGGDAVRFEEHHQSQNWGDRVTLWPETANHGFARGNNVVLRALSKQARPPEYVFLLNPDAQIENDAVTHLADFLIETPNAGAVGAQMLDENGARTSGAFRFPSAIGEFEKSVNFGPVSFLLNRYRVPLSPDQAPGPVDWVSGAAVMFRFVALEKIDFFDPGFFLYYEEVDLMRRLKAAGWGVHYHPQARVLHLEGAATQVVVQKRRPAYLYRSWRRFFSKKGQGYAIFAAFALAIGSLIGLFVAWVFRRPPQVPKQFFRDHWHYVMAPLLGLKRDLGYDEGARA